ncbi:MAG: hypothetical protein HQK95_00680 [Nitrospirae bacterium]|nr:hypothetical protein [Nitrospirota bacterium]
MDTEIDFLNENLSEWLKYYKGHFALVKNAQLIGTFTTPEEAYIEGIKQFGNVPFLVYQIKEEKTVDQIPALMHGLIHAGF